MGLGGGGSIKTFEVTTYFRATILKSRTGFFYKHTFDDADLLTCIINKFYRKRERVREKTHWVFQTSYFFLH